MAKTQNNTQPAHENWLRWLGVALAGAAPIAGWFMPEFYDWTGADQSRPAPIVSWIALGIAVVDVALILSLLYLHIRSSLRRSHHLDNDNMQSAHQAVGISQFSLRQLMTAITVVALLLVIGRWLSPMVGAWIVFLFVFAWASWVALRNTQARWWIVLLVWLQFTPFLWLVRKPVPSVEIFEFIGMLPAFPAFFPAIYLNALLQIHFQSGQWIVSLFSSTTLAIGIWLACQGRKRTLACCLVVMTCSIYGSFLFHAAMRA